jgi:hypothetical protein
MEEHWKIWETYQHNFRLFHLENNSFLHCQHEDKYGQTKEHRIPVESPITESKKYNMCKWELKKKQGGWMVEPRK